MIMPAPDSWTSDGHYLQRAVECPSFIAAINFVTEVAVVAEEMNHHPDIDIRWRTVTLRLRTHSANAITNLDHQLAERIDAIVVDRN